ncbi:DUF1727 domain-containing protein [Actinomyces sp. zg-332]|uniref:MurT ligase domain-containing protein n=1 Tax=Actinomyces sp. zg-332 TaxID=2708340 RepID=UPI0014228720|nr:MurT ligase domain-containing protein [Actinomyces sp. zg-332]QPK94069.1 DUF1727 domain-containing protein [Actinomyces sp. zg-332]
MTQKDGMRMKKLNLRGKFAIFMGKMAAKASRMTGRGNGGMIGGRIALKLDPQIMSKLAYGRKVILVTGTNGKSTTTKMTCAALRTLGEVTTNDLGDNMHDGVVSAMMNNPKAPYVVLEVDEMHLESVARRTDPTGIILLNLTADQLDRVGEIATTEKKVREGVEVSKNAFVVANCDDPMVASAAWDAKERIWCACSLGDTQDCLVFPRTRGVVKYDGLLWVGLDEHGVETNYSRPNADWFYDSESKLYGIGVITEVDVKLPGMANRMNAMQALACAVRLGADVDKAVSAIGKIGNVAGRYSLVDVEGKHVHMLLAKNPAGWNQAISMLDSQAKSIVIGVNDMVGDGIDVSWLWDINFKTLKDIVANNPSCKIYACGMRSYDLAVRLDYAGIPYEICTDPMEAILKSPSGRVELVANYTSFHEVKHEINARGYKYL